LSIAQPNIFRTWKYQGESRQLSYGARKAMMRGKMKRFVPLCTAVLAGCVLAQGTLAATPVPARPLLVEWRVSDQPDNDGGGRQGGSTYASRDAAPPAAVHSLRVLNGQKAQLSWGQSQPVTQWQIGVYADASNRSGWQAWSSTSWVETGEALSIQPSWPGGRRPVKVVLRGRRAAMMPNDAPGQTEHQEVHTTLQIPLGQWTVIAQQGRQPAPPSRRGSWGTADVPDTRAVPCLELRVSAP